MPFLALLLQKRIFSPLEVGLANKRLVSSNKALRGVPFKGACPKLDLGAGAPRRNSQG